MFRLKKQNMMSIIPNLNDREIEYLCSSLEITKQQLLLTNRKKVRAFVRRACTGSTLHDKIEPFWQRVLRAWLFYTLLGFGAVLFVGLAMAFAVVCHWLYTEVSPWTSLLAIPILALVVTGITAANHGL